MKYLNQYYKDLETGAELHFKYSEYYGWCVSLMNEAAINEFEISKIEFPENPKDRQEKIDNNYLKLEENQK